MTLQPFKRKGAGAQNPGQFEKSVSPESGTVLPSSAEIENEAEQLHAYRTLDGEWDYVSDAVRKRYRQWAVDARNYCSEHGIDFQTYLHDDHHESYSVIDHRHL